MDWKFVKLPAGTLYSAVNIPLGLDDGTREKVAGMLAEAIEYLPEHDGTPIHVNFGETRSEGWAVAFALPEGVTV